MGSSGFRSGNESGRSHRRSFAVGLGCLLLGSRASTASPRATPPTGPGSRFLVYYGADEQAAFADYDVLVLEADTDEAVLRAGRNRRATKLGYLSVCEVNMSRAYAGQFHAQGFLLFQNKHWPGARYVDVRDQRWTRQVVERLVPALLERGFDGLFLDTLDDAEYLESSDAARFAGMRDAAVALVRVIRRRYPSAPIMVNRGYGVLPRVVGDVDMVMGESVRSTFDAGRGGYVLMSDEDYRWQCERLRLAKRMRPAIDLFSLDYWSADDLAGIASLYAQARAAGFAACVASIDLQRILPRP